MWRELRGLRSCALGESARRGGEGAAQGSASRDHVTADESRVLQRNSGVQFVGSHNLTSSAKAGCEAAGGTSLSRDG